MAITRRLAGWLAVLCLASIATLLAQPFFTSASRPVRGIADPSVALQMARNVNEVDAVLGEAPSPDREVMRIKQYIDFVFIACYAAFYLVLSVLLARIPGQRWIAIVVACCGLGAAVCDVFENLAILRVLDAPLDRTTQTMIDAIRRPSYAKWTLAFIALALLSRFFFAGRRWTMRTVGALNLLTAAVGFYGLYDNAALVWAGVPLAAGMIGIAALFFRLR